ncbi:MAG: hypothetical protein H6698_08020 [Myxococcales bacterium]|nr:hypothetical protein [Myxococcales bacterium]MCB9534234.1 hypothetical protein [Myxococcales bacterium]
MNRLKLTIVLLASLGVSSAAFGQDRGNTRYEDTTTYDFENDYVEGQLVRPDGDVVSGQRHGKESNLIRIRTDFIPEMVQSVEAL